MKDKVIKIIEKTLNLGEGTITENTIINDVPEWDSLGHVLVIGALNEELELDISIDDAMEMHSVQDILKKAGA